MNREKDAELERLYRTYRQAVEEKFPESAPHEFVWGYGRTDSPLVLIGEAPGKDEVVQGRPFVGKAGGILRDFLDSVHLPAEALFITKAVKYRLSKPGARPGTKVNRPAKREEILFSSLYIKQELDIIKPRIVVTLGNVPLKTVFLSAKSPCCKCGGEKASFSSLPEIGMLHGIPIENVSGEGDCVLFPLYHPASIIYNRSLKTAYEKDLLRLSEMVGKKFFQKRGKRCVNRK